MANRIMLNQTSYHGAGAIAEIVNEAKAHDYKKAFVCSDPDLIKFQVSTKVTDLLDQAGLSYEIYSNIKANPTIENVQTGVAAFKKSGADYIIAIGGGSSMDTALSSQIRNLRTSEAWRALRRPGSRVCRSLLCRQPQVPLQRLRSTMLSRMLRERESLYA